MKTEKTHNSPRRRDGARTKKQKPAYDPTGAPIPFIAPDGKQYYSRRSYLHAQQTKKRAARKREEKLRQKTIPSDDKTKRAAYIDRAITSLDATCEALGEAMLLAPHEHEVLYSAIIGGLATLARHLVTLKGL